MFFLLLLACTADKPANTQPTNSAKESPAEKSQPTKSISGQLDLSQETFETDVRSTTLPTAARMRSRA